LTPPLTPVVGAQNGPFHSRHVDHGYKLGQFERRSQCSKRRSELEIGTANRKRVEINSTASFPFRPTVAPGRRQKLGEEGKGALALFLIANRHGASFLYPGGLTGTRLLLSARTRSIARNALFPFMEGKL